MNQPPLLSMQSISKAYPGVQALQNVSLEILRGECHALVGENGAGKSTLMKILAGAEPLDAGEIALDGTPVTIHSPHQSQKLGIAIIYQEFNLIPTMSIAENVFLGREPSRFGMVDFSREEKEASDILEQLGISLDVRTPVSQLSIAQQQMVEIAKALSTQAKIIAMDEPSATLTSHELKHLFSLIRTLKERGISVIYISHRLEEIFEVCDRLTVLRDGEWVTTTEVHSITREGIIEHMVGRTITDEFPKEIATKGEEIIRTENLSHGFVQNVSFQVHAGEIVGLTGLVGAGRTEVARMLFGADSPDSGTIVLKGKPVVLRSPRHAIDMGICFLTEDRKEQGLILGMRIRENVTLPTLSQFCTFGFLEARKEVDSTGQKIEELRIKTPSGETMTGTLSGGNQQKVVLAKWLMAKSKLFIFDEPTRGIDVGAKREIYLLMNELVKNGAGILMISSELPEVLGMADRILVMSEGRIAGELARDSATQEAIMTLATQGATLSATA